MQLDSVRELKQIVAGRLARQIAARAARLSVATTALDELPRVSRTIAALTVLLLVLARLLPRTVPRPE